MKPKWPDPFGSGHIRVVAWVPIMASYIFATTATTSCLIGAADHKVCELFLLGNFLLGDFLGDFLLGDFLLGDFLFCGHAFLLGFSFVAFGQVLRE